MRAQLAAQPASAERGERLNTLRTAESHLAKRRYAECMAELRRSGEEDKAQDEVETGDLFGFTEGTDLMEPGKREVSTEIRGAFSRRDGRYGVGTFQTSYAMAPVEGLNVEVGAFTNHFSIRNVPGMEDRHLHAFGGFVAEVKWQLAKREATRPFGVTLIAEPTLTFRDQATGERGHGFGIETRLAFDAALVPDVLFGAANLIYEAETFDPRGAPAEQESQLGFSGALSFRAGRDVFVGGEARYLRAYEGLALDQFQGHALFLGPTLNVKLTEQASLAAAWSSQVAGRSTIDPGRPLDLDNFSRHEAKFKLSYEF